MKIQQYDTYLPIGDNCIPAYYLRKYGLRTEAYPLDWMVFGARTFIHLFQTEFSDFFSSIAEEKSIGANSCRSIRDTTNGILSLHHFPKDREIADTLNEFHSKMRRRYLRLHNRLMNSDSILMLGFRQDTEEQVINTLLEFSAIYPHLSSHLINVSDTPEMAASELRQKHYDLNDRLAVTCCYFNNSYDIDNQTKFGLWGNEALWHRILDR